MEQNCNQSEHIGSIYEKLHAIDKRVALLEEAVTDMSEMKTDVHTIKQLLEQGRGVVKTFQFIVWVLGPLIGLIYWWQEHVK